MNKFQQVFIICVCTIAIAWGIPFSLSGQESEAEKKVMILDLEGAISPGTSISLTRGLKAAENQTASLVIIRLDTPGGLVSSMRTMVKSIMNSRIPIVVYVWPKGAGAASAGVLITISAHVSAMAPSTNIGAAHPVTTGGKDIQETMSEKVVNDMASYGRGIAQEKGKNAEWVERAIRESVSVTAEEALKINVIDIVAKDMDDLLQQLDGRKVTVSTGEVTIRTSNIKEIYYNLSFRDKVLELISNPSMAYILMMIGMAGLFFEITHPGTIFPGVIGAISLILAFFSMQVLEVNYAGLLLIILAIVLFIAEIKVTSYGVLSIGGIISLTIGSIMLFENMGVPLKLIIPTIVIISGFFIAVASLALRAYRMKPRGGTEGIIGEVGVVREEIAPEGKVFVHGEIWRAMAKEKIDEGEKVEVEDIQGLILKVRKATNR